MINNLLVYLLYKYEIMSKILVVLESPNKVAKVQAYLGDKYLVTSSKGHIRDLDPNHCQSILRMDLNPIIM